MKPVRLPPVLFLLIFAQFNLANVAILIGLTFYIVDRFGAGDFQVGLIGAISILSYGAVAWAGGALAERFPKRGLMAVGFALLTTSYLAMPFAPTLKLVYLLAGYMGVVQVLIFPANFGLMAESVRPDRVSRILGLIGFGLVLSGMIAAFFVGKIYDRFGPQAMFFIAAGISTSLTVFSAFFAPRPDPEVELAAAGNNDSAPSAEAAVPNASAKPTTVQPLHPNARAFMQAALALNFVGFFMAFTHQTLLVRVATLPEFDLSPSLQSNVQSLRLFAAMVGYLVGAGWNGWHWRRWTVWAIGVGLLIAVVGAAFAPNVWTLTVFIGIGGVCTALCNQLSLYYSIGGGVVGRGQGAGMTETALAMGGGLGPLLAGMAASVAGTPRAAYAVPLVPLLICFVLWARIFSRAKFDRAE